MERVAKFYKVSREQFKRDFEEEFEFYDDKIYNDIILPKRATSGSAGYDFVSPIDFTIEPGATIKIPTGIRCEMEHGWVLQMYPRSSLGFKYKFRPNNLVGIVDMDYFYSNNEGHIWMKMSNEGEKVLAVKAGESFCQGIFVPFGITEDDDCTGKRNGGFGSTGK